MPCNMNISYGPKAAFGPFKEDTEEQATWPTFICDMAIESKPLEAILARRDWYLSEKTGVNVWLGIKYFKDEGTWWMGLCARGAIVGKYQMRITATGLGWVDFLDLNLVRNFHLFRK
jgi:hypothetical protein